MKVDGTVELKEKLEYLETVINAKLTPKAVDKEEEAVMKSLKYA